MLFSSSIFIFLFLPVILFIYFLAPRKLKNLVLLVASIFFYTWGENILVLVMLSSLTIDYLCAILIDKGLRKTGLIFSVIANLVFLGFFKYYVFITENLISLFDYFGYDYTAAELSITLPLGISFYTFQSMSYTIDVYR